MVVKDASAAMAAASDDDGGVIATVTTGQSFASKESDLHNDDGFATASSTSMSDDEEKDGEGEGDATSSRTASDGNTALIDEKEDDDYSEEPPSPPRPPTTSPRPDLKRIETPAAREGLRRELLKRKKSLTAKEFNFLDSLVADGHSREIECARGVLQDEDLFFDPTSDGDDKDCDATDPTITSVDEKEQKDTKEADVNVDEGSPKPSSSDLSLHSRPDDTGTSDLDTELSNEKAKPSQSPPANERNDPSLLSLAKRRESFLRIRRKSVVHSNLWKAHEKGISTNTNINPRSSLVKRRISSTASGNNNSAIDAGATTATVIKAAILFKRPLAEKAASLRRESSEPTQQPQREKRYYHRMSSVLNSVPLDSKFTEESVSGISGQTDEEALMISESGDNASPVVVCSTGRREAEEIFKKERGTGTSRHDSPSRIIPPADPLRARDLSSTSIPSLHHAHPIRRLTSMLSDTTEEGEPLPGTGRQDSASGIIRPVDPLRARDSSSTSVPSLHHAHPLRRLTSMLSDTTEEGEPSYDELSEVDFAPGIPKIRRAHPLRSSSGSLLSPRGGGGTMRVQFEADLTDSNGVTDSTSTFGSSSSLGIARHDFSRLARDTSDATRSSISSLSGGRAQVGRGRRAWASRTKNRVKNRLKKTLRWSLAQQQQRQRRMQIEMGRIRSSRYSPPRSSASAGRMTVARQASINAYQGEGFEVLDLASVGKPNDLLVSSLTSQQLVQDQFYHGRPEESCDGEHDVDIESPEVMRKYRSLVSQSSVGEGASSFDDMMSTASRRRKSAAFRTGDLTDSVGDRFNDEGVESWDMHSEGDEEGVASLLAKSDDVADPVGYFSAWQVLQDDSAIGLGYGGGGTLPFLILGTSADDSSAHPHVLSPPLMESLQYFLPYSVSESNFWLKFSMVRDGSDLISLMQHVRGSKYTILAVETVDGEVFGGFAGTQWRKNWGYFGSGEAFLWRMRGSRAVPCTSVLDQAQLESELEVFPWTGENTMIQVCTSDKIGFGGGTLEQRDCDDGVDVEADDVGFGLAIDSDLLHGTTTPCASFSNPSLSRINSSFEIANMEVWTLTPFMTEEEAEKMEMTLLFLEQDRDD